MCIIGIHKLWKNIEKQTTIQQWVLNDSKHSFKKNMVNYCLNHLFMSSNLCPVWGFSLFFNMVFNSLTLYLSKLTIFANFQKNSVWLNQAGSCHELHWQAAPPCGWECGTKDGCLPFLIGYLMRIICRQIRPLLGDQLMMVRYVIKKYIGSRWS